MMLWTVARTETHATENQDLDWNQSLLHWDWRVALRPSRRLVTESLAQVLYSTSNTCTIITADISSRSERARHVKLTLSGIAMPRMVDMAKGQVLKGNAASTHGGYRYLFQFVQYYLAKGGQGHVYGGFEMPSRFLQE